MPFHHHALPLFCVLGTRRRAKGAQEKYSTDRLT